MMDRTNQPCSAKGLEHGDGSLSGTDIVGAIEGAPLAPFPLPVQPSTLSVGHADASEERDADRRADAALARLRRIPAGRVDGADDHADDHAVPCQPPAASGCGIGVIRRRFVHRQGDSSAAAVEPDRLSLILDALARSCTVPSTVATQLAEAADTDEVHDLVEWLREKGVVATDGNSDLGELVNAAVAEVAIKRGYGDILALAMSLTADDGIPVLDGTHLPAVHFMGSWQSREQLRTWFGVRFPGNKDTYDSDVWQAIPFRTRFAKDFEIWNMLGRLQTAKETARAKVELEKEPRLAPTDQKLLVEPEVVEVTQPSTSLAEMVGQSEEYEKLLGEKAYESDSSGRVAGLLSARVLAFVDEYQKLTGLDLCAEIGTDSKRTAGAVGKDPKNVRAALESGTLHEKLTHVLNFGQKLADLLIEEQKGDRHAFAAAKTSGFQEHEISALAKGASNHRYQALQELKEQIITRKSGPEPVTNTKTPEQLGMTFSSRERSVWGGGHLPTFEVGADNVTVDDEHPWVQQKKAQGFPVKSGPSTHTFELFEMTELLGLRPELTLDEIMLAATGYLLPISAHSLIEIQHVAEQFGMAPVQGPELYGRLMQRLKVGMGITSETRKELAEVLDSPDLGSSDPDKLVQAHHYLLSHGYSFVGYHGTKTASTATSIRSGGLLEKFETREEDDSWRGVYVAPDPKVAQGYLEAVDAQLLRIYAPTTIVTGCIQARLPLSEGSRVEREISRRLKTGKMVPQVGDYLMLGRENGEDDSLESILSWGAAVQCIAIPSLHTKEKTSERELGLPQQTPNPRQLSFEEQHSAGGLEMLPDHGKGDPRDWTPSSEKDTFGIEGTDWDIAAYTSGGDLARREVTARELEILRALDFDVTSRMTWSEVARLTVPKHANASTLAEEMLPTLASVPFDSPIWSDFVYRLKSAEKASEVEPGLYLGGWQSAVDQEWVTGHVKTVLNCCQYNFKKMKDITHERVNVTGYPIGLFEWSSDLIGKAGSKGVLVHCIEGKNRSATLVAGYLMKARRWSATQAIREVVSARPWASPERSDLLGWERHLMEQGVLRSHSGVKGKSSDTGSPELMSSIGDDRDEQWLGTERALSESRREAEDQWAFESVGAEIGLNDFLDLRNVSGAQENCLINALNGALETGASGGRVQEIGQTLRAKKDHAGVESNGYLNAHAISDVIHQLQESREVTQFEGLLGLDEEVDTEAEKTVVDTTPKPRWRVIIIDMAGRIESPEVGITPTFSAEVVGANNPKTVILVNAHLVHFGYARPREPWQAKPFRGQWVDGVQWLQFESH